MLGAGDSHSMQMGEPTEPLPKGAFKQLPEGPESLGEIEGRSQSSCEVVMKLSSVDGHFWGHQCCGKLLLEGGFALEKSLKSDCW